MAVGYHAPRYNRRETRGRVSALQPGQIGPYRVQDMIATGAHSHVYTALGEHGEVALKVARVPWAREALKREAQLLQRTEHPNLSRMVNADPGGAWLALHRVPGSTLDNWSIDQPIASIVQVSTQVVDALAYLHDNDIVHGDVKPTNVIVSPDGVAHLIDLGVATHPGDPVDGFKGTLGYAAPELLSGHPPTPQTDLYGLGALLYTCLAGRTPFVAPDPAALTYLPLVSLPPPVSAFLPEVPSALNQLILTLLARSPSRRPADLHELRRALLESAEGPPRVPLLGMQEAREALRRAVVGAADGESRVVVVYGAPGSGRRTLISEALEYARREGLTYLKETRLDPALAALRQSPKPPAMVMKAAHPGAQRLAEHALREQLSALLLLHADRPAPRLEQAGAVQITPAPLTRQEATRLATLMGANADLAEDWWTDSMGLPVALLGRIRAWKRRKGLPTDHDSDLPSESRRILEALMGKPRMQFEVTDLARELGMGEHTLLDHSEVLFAEGLIEPKEDGLLLAVVRSQGVR